MKTPQNSCKIHSITLAASSAAALLPAVPDNCDALHCSCSAFDRTGCAHLSQKVVQCLSIQFLRGNSLSSVQAEYLLDSRRFWSKFYLKNSIHFISLHYKIYARSNSMKWTLQCDAINVIKPLNNYIVEYSIRFPLVQKVHKFTKKCGSHSQEYSGKFLLATV